MSRLLLQICTGLLALIPIATQAPVLDSNLRFFGGIWLGIGLALLWLVLPIEEQGARYIGFIILELVGAPLFIYWQYRVAQAVARL
ncbi:MAG TPA: DUF4345 family protein [Chloroflexota bacterium]|jgi:uncharacterized protein YjeT (DUF2065 family)